MRDSVTLNMAVKTAAILCALLFSGVAEVHAQSRTSRGNAANNEVMANQNCMAEVEAIEDMILELETFANRLEVCNGSQQVYDPNASGDGCVDVEQISADWAFDANGLPLTLTLRDRGVQVGNVIDVVLGRPGQDGACLDAPVTPPPPPPPPPPATPDNCTSPWNTTVLHDQDVRAYQTASVPNGQNCNSEMRHCDDGNLDGSFTHQSCTVDDPPPQPDYVWRSTGMYSTQQAIPESVADGPCGDQEWVHCRGCATFPFTSNCSQGAACDPNAQYQICLINERQCGFAIAWDRYECMPNFGLPPR